MKSSNGEKNQIITILIFYNKKKLGITFIKINITKIMQTRQRRAIIITF